MLIDSHCHLDFDGLREDLEGTLARAHDAGVDHILCISVTLEDFPRVLDTAGRSDNLFASVGVHPCYPEAEQPGIDQLVELADHPKVVAIGETGLDFMRVEGDMQWQRERFVTHIEAAARADKPLIIHTRAAAQDTVDMLVANRADRSGGVMHCFAENWDIARQALDLGFYISFSGIVTFKSAKAVQEAARLVPLDRLLVETDAPYLAPVPHRGKPNEPAFVRHTAQFLADLRGIPLDELAAHTRRNFFSLFATARPASTPLRAGPQGAPPG
ncbi:MAG: TatD family hydrolase [Pseudomonadota bacterium]